MSGEGQLACFQEQVRKTTLSEMPAGCFCLVDNRVIEIERRRRRRGWRRKEKNKTACRERWRKVERRGRVE